MLDVLSGTDYLLFAMIATFAGFVHGSIGLGFPLIATAMLSTFVDLRIAILITLMPTLTVNTLSMYFGGNWRQSIGQFWPLAGWCLIGSVIGAMVIIYLDPTPFKLLLALLIFLYLALEHTHRQSVKPIVKNHPVTHCGFGLVAGFSAGSTNTMVPILVILSLEAGWAKTVMIQVFNMCFFSGKIAQVTVFSFAGAFDGKVLIATVPFAVIAASSLLVGRQVQRRIDQYRFRQLIKLVLLIVGFILLIQTIIEWTAR